MTRKTVDLVRGAVRRRVLAGCYGGLVGFVAWQGGSERASAQPLLPGTPTTAAPTTTPKSNPTSTVNAPAAAAEPGYLGVIADDLDTDGRGVRLISVMPGGPAEVAALRVGDLVTSINGQAVSTTAQLAEILQPFKENDEVTFVIRRGNEVQRLDIRLGTRPGIDQRALPNFGRQPSAVGSLPNATTSSPPNKVASGSSNPTPESPTNLQTGGVLPTPTPAGEAVPPRSGSLLGVRAVPLSREVQEALNLPDANGALVVEVREGSAAQRAGIPVEAVIVGIDGKTIYSPADLADYLAARGPGVEVRLSYFRYGQLSEKRVRLGPPDAAAVTAGASLPALPELPQPEPPKLPSGDEATVLRQRVRELESRVIELESQLKAKRP